MTEQDTNVTWPPGPERPHDTVFEAAFQQATRCRHDVILGAGQHTCSDQFAFRRSEAEAFDAYQATLRANFADRLGASRRNPDRIWA